MRMTILLPIDPEPQRRPRFSRYGGARLCDKDKEYRERLVFLFKSAYQAKPVDYPLKVRIAFFCQKKKSSKLELPTHIDVDNMVKHILDACNDVIWIDDGQVIDLKATKAFSTEGCILFDVSEFNEADLDALVLESQSLLAPANQDEGNASSSRAGSSSGSQDNRH